ncbi:MAG: hypothetical protein JNL08_03455 [Planctomycetes bacterium]|nr:hypothetical protein [Planctomycetota bacterium]
MRQQAAVFPVGLYGMLLFALCWLTLPNVFAPLERLLLGAVCLVPRAASEWSGQPAFAAEADARERTELRTALATRLRGEDIGGGRALLASDLEPVYCAVREVLGDGSRRGGAGQPAELLLEATHAELDDCAAFVTKGDALLGFLVPAGIGVAADDGPGQPARVVLLHHRAAPPVYAAMPLDDGAHLRLVVRGAATVDPAPLRVDLWDDPYRAARLDRGGHVVRTLALDDGAAAVPPGLQLGRTRIWGYDGDDGQAALAIGVFVVPPYEPRALSHVVVWRDRRRATAVPAAAPADAPQRRFAVVRDLPGAVHGRHLLIAAGEIAAGAAVVQQGMLLGTARDLAFGLGLVTSFGASRHRWSLLLLPDDPEAPPRELDGRVVRAAGHEAWVACHTAADANARLPAGQLFTGSNGPGCPAGLWIGSAEPVADDRTLLLVRTRPLPSPRAVEVWTRPEPSGGR